MKADTEMILEIFMVDRGANVLADKLDIQSVVDLLVSKNSDDFPSLNESEKVGLRRNVEVKKIVDKNVIDRLIRKSNRALVKIYSRVFRFDFSDSFNVQESRVATINRHFVFSDLRCVDIKNISNFPIKKLN